jgi:hypothetical protein
LERVLPARFGGSAVDYQLLEGHTAEGLARYSLLVSPEVGPLPAEAVAAALLAELSKLGGAYRLMAAMWAEAGVLKVERRRPEATGRGKVLPVRVLGAAAREGPQ